MSENEAPVVEASPEATAEEPAFAYSVKVEDAGPAAKRVTVEIPRDRITAKLEEQYKELRQQASIPGFRVGHVPRKLLERRFSGEVKDQVASALIRESYEQALTTNDLKVIGEPEFDEQEKITLPEEGSLNYSFNVEVQPQITLPDFSALAVKKPKIAITEANVDQAMQNLREQQGALIPVEDRGVESGDYVIADVHVMLDGNIVSHAHDAQIVARAGRVAGIEIPDLDAQLAGAKSGETRTVTIKAPASHANEQLRDKDVQIEIAVKDVKRLELAEINQSFLEDLGFENQQELRDALREQMEEKINSDIQQAMREQVSKFLLENTQFELPAKLSQAQANRVVSRRGVDLMMRGMTREQVEANLDRLRAGADEEAARELKLFFMLQKIAGEHQVDVSERELNGRIAFMAAQRDIRPEKLKQTMEKDGSLSELFIQMREQKAVDQILTQAKIEEIEMTPQQGEAAAAPASEPATQAEGAAEGETAPPA